MRARSLPGLLVLPFLLLGGPDAPADEEDGEAARPEFRHAPARGEATGPDADMFWKAVDLQQEGKYRSARRILLDLVEQYPDSPFAGEADDRSGAGDGGNAFLGYTPMHELGPVEQRIDVALMGDGYLFEKQDGFDKAAEGHLQVLLGEAAYAEYAPYFNFYRFNLASKDTGVDEVARPPPDEELEEHKRKRKKKVRLPREFQTALDCKAAGPQGQVMANPSRVWHYLSYLKDNDNLAVCFAQKGTLGMGGMGIATTGPRGVVVHEFGHAFPGLLDEYAVNPGEPGGAVESANTTTHPDDPPWKHFLDAKVPGVGVYEGGATFVKGVWRPAPSCAMNIGGGGGYCPVCREATVLTIYTYVSPIEEARPNIGSVRRSDAGWPDFVVVPMRPASHDLEVEWWLGQAPAVTATTPPEGEGTEMPGDDDEEGMTPLERRLRDRLRRQREAAGGAPAAPGGEAEATAPPAPWPYRPGARRRHQGTANEPPPPGKPIRAEKAKARDGVAGWRAVLPPTLPPGRHVLTAVVRDRTRLKGQKFPWVLKDERGLLEDRRTWTLEVPEAGAPAR